jgi:hypothetical protein
MAQLYALPNEEESDSLNKKVIAINKEIYEIMAGKQKQRIM